MKFRITRTETLEHVITVEAETYEEAERAAMLQKEPEWEHVDYYIDFVAIAIEIE